jgi:hypothetical protein
MNTKLHTNRFKIALKNSFLLTLSVLMLIVVTQESCKDEKDVEIDPTAYLAFRDAVNTPPANWNGHKFELSHDYPTTLPKGGSEMPWLKIDVDFIDKNPDWKTGKWREYMDAIIDYSFEGQDPNLTNDVGWKKDVQGDTRWFHVPWMAYSPSAGREFIHGCTSERIASISEFNGDLVRSPGIGKLPHTNEDDAITHFETWAVGMYNEYAGYSFGQLFPSSGAPTVVSEGGKTLPAGLPFPEGTCVIKTLFTTATSNEVPFLVNSPEWQVNRHVLQGDTTYLCERKPQPVYLIQVDVAVADKRSPTNWVFGTFAYNGTLDGTTAKDRLDPVGIQYAMDDKTFPAVEQDASIPAYQSVLNEGINIYEHFGCNGRLCGPVDNPQASCMSCHGGGYTAPMNQIDSMGTNIPAIFGFEGICDTFNISNRAFFSSRKYPEPYYTGLYPDAIPLDFSLQVQVAFTQYKLFKINGSPGDCYPTTPK